MTYFLIIMRNFLIIMTYFLVIMSRNNDLVSRNNEKLSRNNDLTLLQKKKKTYSTHAQCNSDGKLATSAGQSHAGTLQTLPVL